MLYVLTALKCEASQLRAIDGEIVVTGVGDRCLNSLEKLCLGKDDRVVNVGVCAASSDTAQKGECVLATSIKSEATGRVFYPDLPSSLKLAQLPLITASQIVENPQKGYIYDMEAAIIAEYAFKTIPPSAFMALKVVSDSGDTIPSAEQVSQLIREALPSVYDAIGTLGRKPSDSYRVFNDSLKDEFRLTSYMWNEFLELEHYCVVAGKQEILKTIIEGMRMQGIIPVKDKRCAREVLDELFSRLR